MSNDNFITCRYCGIDLPDTGKECPRCEHNRDTGREVTSMDYITKVRATANLCEEADVENSEYLRGICEFIAETEELDSEEYGYELDIRSQGVRLDIKMMIAMIKNNNRKESK